MSSTSKSLIAEHPIWPTLTEHSVKIAFQFDYQISQGEQKKLYISFNFGTIENKTDILTSKEVRWGCANDVLVNQDFLFNLYNKNGEFIIWEVVKTFDNPTERVKGESKKKETVVKASRRRNEKPVSPESKKMSLAQTGWKKKNAKQVSGSDERLDQGFGKDWIDSHSRKGRPRSASDSTIKYRSTYTYNEIEKKEKEIASIPSIADAWNSESFQLPESHPHHFDHPEKYIPSPNTARSIPSRTSSSLSDAAIARSKTPPSPHHFDHPLQTVVPNGQVPIINIKKKDIKTANMERSDIKARLRKNQQPDMSQEKPTRQSSAKSDERTVRWDQEVKGVRHTFWNDLDPNSIQRKANDQTIEATAVKPVVEKRKGDYTHYPIGRIKLDVSSLFMGALDAHVELGAIVPGLNMCDIKIRLDSPLLSPQQSLILNPMMITLMKIDALPNEHEFKQRDKNCLPVWTKFTFFNDAYEHKTVINTPRQKRLVLDAHHMILAGLLNPKVLYDQLVTKKMILEIHDQAYKHPKDVSAIKAELRANGVIQKDLNPTHPYGIAEFTFEELCKGELFVKKRSPVLPAHTKASVPVSEWTKNFTTCTISIQLSNPIFKDQDKYIEKIALVTTRLAGEITEFIETQQSPENEKITGFHIADPNIDLFILQGKKEKLEKLSFPGIEIYKSPGPTFDEIDRFFSPCLVHINVPLMDELLEKKSAYLSGNEFKIINFVKKVFKTKKKMQKGKNQSYWPTRQELYKFAEMYGKIQVFKQRVKQTRQEFKQETRTVIDEKIETRDQKIQKKKVSRTDSQNEEWYTRRKLNKLREPRFTVLNAIAKPYEQKYYATRDQTIFNYSCQTLKEKRTISIK